MTDIGARAGGRVVTLDVVRGVAVMGILLANLPGFALPAAAYTSPLPWGGIDLGDRIAWALTYVLVEGKMRGLFSFLFGASVLLVIERARAAGDDEAGVHFARMTWLFLFGIAHLYLVWSGDILHHYAAIGAIAFLFRNLSVRALVIAGLCLVSVQVLLFVGITVTAFLLPGGGATEMFGTGDRGAMSAEIRAFRGGWLDNVAHNIANDAFTPIGLFLVGGFETLGYMLWGMAGLRSGMLTGAWPRARYLRWVRWTLPIGWAAYASLAWLVIARGFDGRYIAVASFGASTPLRPVLITGYACVIVLAVRPGGWLTERVAAVGRAAFTNYLGTSVLMTFVFHGWGLGQFGRVGRAEMYWLAPLAWALMLLWSKPWLDRYRYGPLEWLWRSLARLEWQPLQRQR
ncbi:DUF418 domain-containing protein [uncultured Sphingomonas sp.]|uniref:DUF418 domain-containing protein n=1 Tax=uncultured Sphingomonas sp. TaxID=158754 RepID=UPI0035CB6630